MTQRTEVQQRMLEYKSILTTWIAGKLFTFRETGLDGWIKRRMLSNEGARKQVD